MNVLVLGITGQTASYTAKFLIDKGHSVTGTSRNKIHASLENLKKLEVDTANLNIISLDPSDARQVFSLLATSTFDAIINLAGQTSVGLSFEQPAQAFDSISTSCLNFIEAIKVLKLDTRYFNAASSECFGNTGSCRANEETPFRPNSPYAVAKSSAYHLTRLAREAYGLQTCSGIFSNHESPLRSAQFVTRKIIDGLKKIKEDRSDHLVLGNLDTTRDWGFAPDYARAVVQIVESNQCDDFIIATGQSHSLRSFIDIASKVLGLTKPVTVIRDASLIRPLDVKVCRLSPAKIYKQLGWKATVDFESLVNKLVYGHLF